MRKLLPFLLWIGMTPSVWSQCETSKLAAPDSTTAAEFGRSVAVLDDVIAVGAIRADSPAGAVYLSRRVQGEWAFEQKLVSPDPIASNWFGVSVALDGDRLLVGAPLTDVGAEASAGSAYFFQWNGSLWAHEQTLIASDGESGDHFGMDVDFEGDLAVLCAGRADHSGLTEAGAAYVFNFSAGQWIEGQKIIDDDPRDFRNFASTVDLDGNRIVFGAPFDDEVSDDSGAVYVFEYSGLSWEQRRKIKASDAGLQEQFGTDVSLDGDRLLIGAPLRDSFGGAYIVEWDLGNWTETAILDPNNGVLSQLTGASVALEGNWALVGEAALSGTSEVQFYRFDGVAGWNLAGAVEASDSHGGNLFGSALAVQDGVAVVGASRANVGQDPAAGAAYALAFGDAIASWQNYGSGWPGTLGVPTLTASPAPFLGQTLDVTLSNSFGASTVGWLMIGLQSAVIPTNRGGTLLLTPTLVQFVSIPMSGLSLSGALNCDAGLAGIPVYLQALQSDSGASHGIAFTDGLELSLGY